MSYAAPTMSTRVFAFEPLTMFGHYAERSIWDILLFRPKVWVPGMWDKFVTECGAPRWWEDQVE